ncbi:TraR/DksA C4-type zinc finger protein [Azospirillum agricola]|uniref:TraR/DksA C4-type zinc finger protein n=1 Tax=Azospirillum agricola TaxID=1720247 RepID=UPI000A0F35DA|nr:TraR/DksA C4-type zinc finger protein [Azospirillum agricola]SMH62855.1 transcriptional regulator, TraR/DksA family [Azospirillum lipoferum]
MADDADRAAEAAARIDLMAPVADIRDRLAAPGRDHCQDCGEPIPTARRIAYEAATRCIDCQTETEERPR